MEFIGREQELSELESIWAKAGVKGCSVIGRRQIGKSTLLKFFSQGKHCFQIQFNRRSPVENMYYFRERVSSFLGRDVPETDILTELFLSIVEGCHDGPTLVILDEFPYLVEDFPQAASVLQRFMDRDLEGMDAMVVICGSSIGMMRELVESMNSPLYGRIDHTIDVGPLTFEKCCEFHPDMDGVDALKLYMTLGGVPKYHARVKGGTYGECIRRHFIEDDLMIDEGARIITDELSPGSRYSELVFIISRGEVKQNRIADKMGMDPGNCKRYLDNLEKIKVISKREPMLNAPSKPYYYISDPMVDFHFSVLCRWRQTIGGAMDSEIVYGMMEHDIDTFLGRRFESFCGEWLDRVMNVKRRGIWWGRVDGVDTDIDIVADVVNRELFVHTLLVECKFRKNRIGFSAYNDLVERSEVAGAGDNTRYMMISIAGFDTRLCEYAEDNGVLLIGPDELLGNALSEDSWMRDAMISLGMRQSF
ncbi:MAG: ATP-binding protein [Candidatus Methanomethylophilaceae archaeon]